MNTNTSKNVWVDQNESKVDENEKDKNVDGRVAYYFNLIDMFKMKTQCRVWVEVCPSQSIVPNVRYMTIRSRSRFPMS